MAEERAFYGSWKIVECVSLAGTVESTGIEGTEFHLDESGDVSWKVADDAEPMPFFSCETYEVSVGDPTILKFFGTFAGHIIEFRVEVSDDLMLLTLERCCMLQCQRVSTGDPKDEEPFSFLNALEEGYFTDITIKAANGREFKVHQAILKLAVPCIDWTQSPLPLEGLPEDVLHTVLGFMYSECLPRGLSEDTAKDCLKHLGRTPGFTQFCSLCETFLKNTALRQQIESLVNDMHACADKIIDLFSGKGAGLDGQPLAEDGLMSNPARLCYIFKQAVRESAVAGAKFVILCDLFSRRKGELSREERHDVIKYAMSRLPIFMNQLKKFLEVCKQHFRTLTAGQRYEIANYLVPEIETAFDTMSTFIVDIKGALEQVINLSSSERSAEKHEKHKKGHVGDVLGKTLKNALHMRELMKMKKFHEKTTASFINLVQKKENFSVMPEEEKVRFVSKQLEHIADEVPLFLFRIEEIMGALDQKLTWREWKYLFKLGTSKVAWGLNKVQVHKATLRATINKAREMVHRDQFNASLVTLNLQGQQSQAEGATCVPIKSSPTTKYAQLSSVESLCIPPYARDSKLGHAALELLHSREHTDMMFELIIANEGGDTVIDHTQGQPEVRTEPEGPVETHQFSAHCVVIAARCDWFRRALLSGMRESIDKKITVHDTSPQLFMLFLEYLYSGQLDTNDLSTEQLADLLALSDRYEMDSLKRLCGHALKHHLDDDSALFLLSLADQYHARSLRGAAMGYVKDHPVVATSDIFQELPHHLQAEVEDACYSLEPRSRNLSGLSHTETPSSLSSTSEVDELVSALELVDRNDPSSSSSSEELPPFTGDSARLESCLAALRDIVGHDVPEVELIPVALAADYDINRALNFFFSS